jgi:hypothetical protein
MPQAPESDDEERAQPQRRRRADLGPVGPGHAAVDERLERAARVEPVGRLVERVDRLAEDRDRIGVWRVYGAYRRERARDRPATQASPPPSAT